MLSTRSGGASKPAVDTSVNKLGYTSFQSHEGIRSPRSPTYMPDPSALTFLPPFDPARILSSSEQPFSTNQVTTMTNSHLKAKLPPPPEEPLTWVWICHLCHSRYPLGVTRRCLVDGHYYCSGEAAQPNLRKRKKRQSCSSEFDYVTWRAWGAWKRKARKILKSPRSLKGCEKCVFPSQCRYPPDPEEDVDQNEIPEIDEETDLGQVQSDGDYIMSESDVNEDNDTVSIPAPVSTANQNINFDQILSNILDDNDDTSMTSDSYIEASSPNKTGKKGKKRVVSEPDDQKTRESNRLKQLIGPDLWNNLEDIDLEPPRME